jgi:hypothetical protein
MDEDLAFFLIFVGVCSMFPIIVTVSVMSCVACARTRKWAARRRGHAAHNYSRIPPSSKDTPTDLESATTSLKEQEGEDDNASDSDASEASFEALDSEDEETLASIRARRAERQVKRDAELDMTFAQKFAQEFRGAFKGNAKKHAARQERKAEGERRKIAREAVRSYIRETRRLERRRAERAEEGEGLELPSYGESKMEA